MHHIKDYLSIEQLCEGNNTILSERVLVNKESVVLEVVIYFFRGLVSRHYCYHVKRIHGPDTAGLPAPCPSVVPDLEGVNRGGDTPSGRHAPHARYIWGLI